MLAGASERDSLSLTPSTWPLLACHSRLASSSSSSRVPPTTTTTTHSIAQYSPSHDPGLHSIAKQNGILASTTTHTHCLIQHPSSHDPHGLHSITRPNGTLASTTITGLYNRHVNQNAHDVGLTTARNGTTKTWALHTGNGHTCGSKPMHHEGTARAARESCPPPLWHRPLGYCEKLMTSAHNYGCMTTVYALWLESKRVVEFDLIKQASYIVSR